MLLVIARHLMTRKHVSVCPDGNHSPVSLAHGCTATVFACAGIYRSQSVEIRPRIKSSELPDGKVHIVIARCVLLPEKQRLIKVFFKRKAGIARVLHPPRSFRRANDAHFGNAHFIEHFRRLEHGSAVTAVHIRLHLDGKAAFKAKRNRFQSRLLRALMVAHPVVITDTIKGYFHKRNTAYRPHFVKHLLIYKISVRIQLLNIHSARVNSFENIEKILMEHRFAARYRKGVYSAVASLVKKVICLVHAPFAHKRGIISRVKAMNTVIVALSRYHQVHCGKIAVRANAHPAPLG